MKKLLFFAVIFNAFSVFSQAPKIKFGEVSREELEMKVYPKDSSADAVVLYDYGNYTYDFSGNLPHVYYERHVRIKILKKSGYEYATIQIPYRQQDVESNSEIVKDLEATTYNLDNNNIQKTALGKEAIFDEKTSARYHTMKFTMPKVKEGSVIEYKYVINSGVWYSLRTWEFQQEIPVIWSELNAVIPAYFDYKITMIGNNPLAIQQTKEGKSNFIPRTNEGYQNIEDPFLAYRFAMSYIPALKVDDNITTVEDYRSSIDFELARSNFPGDIPRNYSVTYPDLTKTLLEDDNYGKILRKFSKNAEKIAADIRQQSGNDSLTLITNAYNFVRNKIRWNEESRLACEKLDKVYEKQIGNCTEINFVLIAILRELGFNANPVILSTRSHGKVFKDIALMDRFNYTIAQLPFHGKDFLLDATDQFVKPNMLPKRCLNERGWLLDAKNPKWVSLFPVQKYRTTKVLNFSIEKDQQLKGNFSETFSGYAAVELLTKINKEGKEKFLEKYKNQNQNLENATIAFKQNEADPLIDFQTTVNDAYTIAGSRIFLKPLLWFATAQNPFKQTERNYPIDFGYPEQETIIAEYAIPAGYAVESLPASVNMGMPNGNGKFFFEVKSQEGKIKISSLISLTKPIYTVEDYFNIRELYNQIVAKQNEQIVLKKN